MANEISYPLKTVWNEDFSIPNPSWIYDNCIPRKGITCSEKSKAYHNKYLTFDTFYQRSTVKILNTSSIFGLICNNEWKGAIYVVDSIKNTISIHSDFLGDYTVPTTKAIKPLHFKLSMNSKYILEVYKTGWKHVFTITDTRTKQKTSVSFDNATQPDSSFYCGKGWGAPGVISLKGKVLFENHSYACALFPKAKVLFIGDSITEGTNMGENVSIENRWCNQLKEKLLNGDAVICGRGGADIDDCLARYHDIIQLGFKFETVILLDGMNERHAEGVKNWKVKVQKFYDQVVSQGARPIICVNPVPESGNESLQEMRDFILAKGWHTIRFDDALSLNGDGVTHDPTLFTDGVHPNKLGQDAMYQQALIDLETNL